MLPQLHTAKIKEKKSKRKTLLPSKILAIPHAKKNHS